MLHKFFYKKVAKPLLFQMDPERVHRAILPFGRTAGQVAPARGALGAMYGYHKNDAEVVVDGVRYHTPVVLAAGFDPNGDLVETLGSLAFGGEEVGSVTARPCKGNPAPNQIRLKNTRSLVVNKGLRNKGVEYVAEHLSKTQPPTNFAVGVSVARTNDDAACELESGIDDYFASFKHLVTRNVGAWYTINISCPNTFTGELFLEPDNLDKLLTKLETVETKTPIYLKMPISRPKEEYFALADVAAKHRVHGLITGNLQKDYSHISPKDTRPEKYTGGLSGVPCRDASNQLLSLTKERYDDRFTLIGCGGVMSVEDAMDKFDRGASLIHMISGMIFEGPHLIRDIAKAYAHRRNISE